jgi:hypothetical protein
MFISQSVCLFACPCICPLNNYPFFLLFICLHVSLLSFSLTVHLSVSLAVYLTACLSAHLSVLLPVWLSVVLLSTRLYSCPSVCPVAGADLHPPPPPLRNVRNYTVPAPGLVCGVLWRFFKYFCHSVDSRAASAELVSLASSFSCSLFFVQLVVFAAS